MAGSSRESAGYGRQLYPVPPRSLGEPSKAFSPRAELAAPAISSAWRRRMPAISIQLGAPAGLLQVWPPRANPSSADAADWVLTTSRVRGSLPLPRRRSRAAARSRHGGGNREARFQTLRPQNAGGFSALNGALCAANEGGWRIARLALRNSGETSGDYGRVVGVVCYGAWALSATSAS